MEPKALRSNVTRSVWHQRMGRLIFLLLIGCSGQRNQPLPTNKLDAEELGYKGEFDPLIEGASKAAYDLSNAAEDVRKFAKLGDKAQEQKASQTLASAYALLTKSADDLPRLKKALPPEALEELHQNTIELLEKVRSGTRADQLVDDCITYHKAVKRVGEELQKRPDRPEVAGEPINLVVDFTVRGVRMRADFGTGAFTVFTPFKLPGAEYREKKAARAQGIQKLIIRAHERERYFSMARDFKVFVPTDYGVSVGNETRTRRLPQGGEQVEQVLVIDVVSNGSSTTTLKPLDPAKDPGASLPVVVPDSVGKPLDRPKGPVASLRLVVPDSVTVEAGYPCKIALTLTREHCAGPIVVRLAVPSPGITTRKGLISASASEGFVELVADATAPPGVQTVKLLAICGAARSEADVTVTLRNERLARQVKNSLGMKMVFIPKGRFQMGTPDGERVSFEDERPQHEVEISRDFHMATTKVTVGQFRQFVKDDRYQTEPERDGKGGYGFDVKTGKFVSSPRYTWKNPGWEQTDEHPVVLVTWNDAVKFCEWLSRKEQKTYELPTEAEWEYACRAGSTEAYCFGTDVRQLTDYAWFDANAGNIGPQPVGKKKANDWGLHDMHGNAWEWCLDGSRKYRTGYFKDPVGDVKADFRAMRGGAWNSNMIGCRSTSRVKFYASGYRGTHVGFRVVLRAAVSTP